MKKKKAVLGKKEKTPQDVKKPKGAAKRSRLRLSGKYPWKILENLVSDLQADESVCSIAREHLTQCLVPLIRHRNVEGYMMFCDQFSLRTINNVSEKFDPKHLRLIRWMRLLTTAQKYESFENSPYDPEKTALDSFLKYENQCKQVNFGGRLFHLYQGNDDSGSTILDIFCYPVLEHAASFIRRVLDVRPPLEDIFQEAHHGPGASVGCSGTDAIPIAKFLPPFYVSETARNIFFECLLGDHHWRKCVYEWWYSTGRHSACVNGDYVLPHLTVDGPWEGVEVDHLPIDNLTTVVNRSMIAFVPKNAKTKRTIAVEPTGNVFLQLGVGNYIRKRLKNLYGIDLQTQLKNQALARYGSIHNGLATIDLSGASDTISLIWMNLLPEEWVDFLLALRCEEGTLPSGDVVRFEKISSMGNGFTFPLETLIFASLIYGVAKVRGKEWREIHPMTAVYGDDIIIPVDLYSDLSCMLRLTGFKENTQKTFTNGLIRESCGYDWYAGHKVTRPTLKSLPKDHWEVIRDHNLLYLLGHDYNMCLRSSLQYLRSLLPKKTYGPMNHFDVISWVFSDSPDTPDGVRHVAVKPCKCSMTVDKYSGKDSFVTVHSESCCFQTEGYNIKGIELQPCALKLTNSKRRTRKQFMPLLYYQSLGQKPWWIDWKIKNQMGTPLLAYSKKHLVPRPRNIFIPTYLWSGAAYSNSIAATARPRDRELHTYFNYIGLGVF